MTGPAWPYYRLISVYTDYRLVPLLPDTWSNLNTTCDSLGGQLQWFDATDDLYHLQDQWRVFDGLSNGQYFTGWESHFLGHPGTAKLFYFYSQVITCVLPITTFYINLTC